MWRGIKTNPKPIRFYRAGFEIPGSATLDRCANGGGGGGLDLPNLKFLWGVKVWGRMYIFKTENSVIFLKFMDKNSWERGIFTHHAHAPPPPPIYSSCSCTPPPPPWIPYWMDSSILIQCGYAGLITDLKSFLKIVKFIRTLFRPYLLFSPI